MTLEDESHATVYILSVINLLCCLLALLKGTLRAGHGTMPGIICSRFLYVFHPYNLNKTKPVSEHCYLILAAVAC